MNIVVFIKQVPDTNDVKWTENNNIDRSKTDCIINPLDLEALEAAMDLKTKTEANVVAATMGPKGAVQILKEAVARGADEAVLLCDSKFAGSDTCATSKVLAAFIKEKYPDTDLIIFGQSAIDGETSQTGTSTAARLGIPFATRVNEIKDLTKTDITVVSETETQKTTCKLSLPAAICINGYIKAPELPLIRGYIRAQEYEIKTYTMQDLKLNPDDAGIKGSPTYVWKVYRSTEKRNCRFLSENIAQEVKEFITEAMEA